VQLRLHIVVVEVVEHVLNIFEGFLVALISPLTHDVCYLGYCVF
jgi:hypothetical protein